MKHNWKKSSLVFLLTLLMLVGLFSALGGSAWAQTDTYTSLIPTSTDDATALSGKVVKFNEIDWYIIEDNSTSLNAGTVTLFAKDPVVKSKFYSNRNDSNANAYSRSVVKAYLDNQVTVSGSFAHVADAIAPTDLNDVGVTGAKLYLLSEEEATILPVGVRKCSNAIASYWWLRSPSSSTNSARNIYYSSGSIKAAFVDGEYGVRPALKLKLSKTSFDSTSRVFTVVEEYSVTVSGGGNAAVSGGDTNQVVQSGAMTTVIYTANSGYRFKDFADITSNGITATRTSDTVVTVSGTPTADVSITIPDAVEDLNLGPVSYLSWNGSALESATCENYTIVDALTTVFEDDGWYVVYGTTPIEINSRVQVSGTAHLILMDGATLNAKAGITVEGSNRLNIYAQSEGDNMGVLNTTALPDESSVTKIYPAGIGSYNTHGGTVVINGGKITAYGNQSGSTSAISGAGIGGGFTYYSPSVYVHEYTGFRGVDITINSGIVTATGGKCSPGIGNGFNAGIQAVSSVTINGGTVIATGGNRGAGIGGGQDSSGADVTINGGDITAISSMAGAGIGGGPGVNSGYAPTITINGGTVTASGGNSGDGYGRGAGIGAGQDKIVIGPNVAIYAGSQPNPTTLVSDFETNHAQQYVSTVNATTITSVTLDKTTSQSINEGDKVSFTAAVEPSNATDRTVKWSVSDGTKLKLYSDSTCTTEIGTDATETLTVYAKGIAAGTATVTVTSNADENKSASCEVTVNALAPVTYMDWNGTKLVSATCADYFPVTSSTSTFENGKWYVVNSDVNVTGGITVNGTAHLILCDGKTLTVDGGQRNAGIHVSNDNSLTIYGQSTDAQHMGRLNATGGWYSAGIGGRYVHDASNNHGGTETKGGTITINGGNITATGCQARTNGVWQIGGAGIGGAYYDEGGSITINGGIITANGGYGEYCGSAGIGTGYWGGNTQSGNTGSTMVTINGGTVTATGYKSGAGIGGGYHNKGGTVIINDGTVTATGSDGGAGIGGGGTSVNTGGDGGTTTINGGTVIATGVNGGAGIGGGNRGAGGRTIINGGSVTATGGEALDWSTSPATVLGTAAGIGSGYYNENTGTVELGTGVRMYAGDSADTAIEVTDTFAGSHTQPYASTEKPDIPITGSVPYKAATVNEETHIVTFSDAQCDDYQLVTPSTTAFENGKWYVVSGSTPIDINSRITVDGTAHLILCDGATLNANAGIQVGDSDSLNIYAQSIGNGTGTLNATAPAEVDMDYPYAAGIGSDGDPQTGNAGTVTINGGNVTASGANGSAGIGGGYAKRGATVTINGGDVTANGSNGGAGIGSGAGYIYGASGSVTINGGTVTATGGSSNDYLIGGAGIGGGHGAHGENVTVYNGTVTAIGGTAAAGIGDGANCGPGEGTYVTDAGFTVTIKGGTVTATGGNGGTGPDQDDNTTTYGHGAGIGGGYSRRFNSDPYQSWNRGTMDFDTSAVIIYAGSSSENMEETPYTSLLEMFGFKNAHDQQYVRIEPGTSESYTVTVTETANGTVTSDKETAAENETVTLTAAPSAGYGLTAISAVWGDTQTPLTLTPDPTNTNKYTFTMPAGDVSVSATFGTPHIHKDADGNDITFRLWTGTDSLPASGDWYLAGDVTLANEQFIGSNTTLNLCLDGHSINGAAKSLVFNVYGTLNLYDEQANAGVITNTDMGANVGTGGIFTMYGGQIKDATGTGVHDIGTFTMYGGSITGSDGMGVNVSTSGTFTMRGGSITGSGNDGVNVSTGGTFTMYDGSITGNTGSQAGGVENHGTFNMNGGEISGNTAKNSNVNAVCGGVYHDGTAFTVSGNAIITNNNRVNPDSPNVQLPGNVYLNGNKLITVGTLGTSASIGVTGSNNQRITDETGKTYRDSFFADNDDGAYTKLAVSVGTDGLYLTNDHVHEWTYQAENATITATCGNTDTGHQGSTTETVTIVAPTGTPVYDGTTAFAATIADNKTSVGGISPLPAIQYEKKAGETWGSATSTAPKDAGTYRASITVDTNKTASVEYTVAKGSADELTVTEAAAALNISYPNETAAIMNGVTGLELSTDGANAATQLPVSLTSIFDAAGTPTIYVRRAQNDNQLPGAWVPVTLASRPAAPTGLTTENATHGGTADGKIKGTTTAMEYSSDGSTWNAASASETLVTPGTYDVRIKATDTTPHSNPSSVTVGSNYKALGDDTPVTIKKGDTAIGSTAPVVDDVLTASCDASDVIYQWYRGDTPISSATGSSYTVTKDDVGQTIKVIATQTKNSDGNAYTAGQAPTKASDPTSAVVKKTPVTPTAEEAKNAVNVNYPAETAEPSNGYELSTDGTNKANAPVSLTSIIDGGGTPTIYVRKAATDDTAASAWVPVTLASRPAAPTGLTSENATNGGTADGKINGTTTAMEYSANNGTTWTTVTADPTLVTPGTYLVRVKATDTAPHSNPTSVTVGSREIILTDDQKPTAKTNLVYDSTSQMLVNAPSAALPAGATGIRYAIGNNPTNAPTNGWSESIPTGIEDGSYYVWFKVLGDENHDDTEPACITVKIAKQFYTVSFDANGGTNAPAAQTKNSSEALILTSEIPSRYNNGAYVVSFEPNGGTMTGKVTYAQHRTYFQFTGWNTEPDGTGTSYAAGAAYSENDEVTLYAQWTKSGEATASIPLPTPVLEGHVFQGWTIDPEGETGMTGRYTPERNTTLYALWTIGTYTITFDTDGGTEIAPITGKFGSAVTAPENPTKPGYDFKGWDKAIPETMPGEDMTIKALYEAQPFGEADFILPAFLTEIEEEAFEGAAMTSVYVPDTCTVIGANAFKDCTQLEKIRLPQDCEIDDTIFNGCKDPAVYAPAGGSTEKWCKAQGISFLPEAAE